MKTAASLAAHPLFYVGLLVIILAVFGLQLGLYSQINNVFFPGSNSQVNRNLFSVSTLINYGNGSYTWHNKTNIPTGWNFYQLTITIAKVDATSSPAVQNEHYIKAIDGVSQAGGYYWTLWVYCQKNMAWSASPVGADLIKLTNNQVLAWYYQNPPSIDPSTWKAPMAGAATVSICS